MANSNSYLYEALMAKTAQKETLKDEEIHLDDISRVKVLSPGRQVFKRFIRNRLAVFGSMLLIIMFLFSFFGPLFYRYGQKQIFYKFDKQNVNYGMAKENTAYNGYSIDSSIEIERPVVNAINSNIKQMIAKGQDHAVLFGESGVYALQKTGEEIYVLSQLGTAPVCTLGSGTVKVGVYDSIRKSISFSGAEIPGLVEAASSIKGKGGVVELEGISYTFTKGVGKSFDITAEMSGIQYSGEVPENGFEEALEQAVQEESAAFFFSETEFITKANGSMTEVFRVNSEAPARVFSRLTADTRQLGQQVSEEFRVGALLATADGSTFSADSRTFTVAYKDDVLTVLDEDGNEYAEFTVFSVRRYTGEDSMAYDLKKAIVEHIAGMEAAGLKTDSLVYALPQQAANGEYVYDDDGNLLYNDSEMTISRRDTGEYVINAEQVIYVIDMFSPPTSKHILGTDGDGFDVLSRVMYGGRISLMVGFVVVFLECFLGIVMGGLAGYYGGWVDMLIMRLVDIFYCLPSLPIMIILGATMDALRMDTYIRLLIMMAALGIMGWAGVARLVRGQILSLREQEFMVATEATGIKVKDRIFHHLVPNVMPQLIVTATMGMGSVIITESTLSFLGLGVKHPLATWGTIINSVSSASAMAHYAHIWIPVGLLICLTVIAFNFVGDGLRDAYDPKAKR
ncbi:MAG: ABC transporter permease [Oscillospiraceae bacterium]|nr:ABC transporter permease [Oscillospiraceae bacterium]